MIQGDCLTELRSLPDGCVDAVIVDPPYGISYQSKQRREPMGKLVNDDRPFIWWLFDGHRVTRKGGAIQCFCRADVQEVFREAMLNAGFTYRSQVIWDRMQHGKGDTRATYAPQHDVIWFGSKGRFAFRNGRPRSILRVKRMHYRLASHPTQKPVELMAQLIEHVTAPGELVLDPTCGSGSTGVAAVQLGRRFIGMELDQVHARTARRRMRGT